MADLCGEPKSQGSETLTCQLDAGHKDETGPTWHRAVVTDHRVMDFGTSRIEADTTEVIIWEPLAEKIRRAMQRPASVPAQ